LRAHLDLLRLLVVREIRTRYARTALGALWAVIPPLVTAGLFTALDFGRFLGEGTASAGVSYPAFAFSGMIFWGHFSQTLLSATSSVALSRDMLHKSKFPAEVIPASKVLAGLLDLAIGIALLVALLLVRGVGVPATAALVPAVFVLQLAFTMGLALFFSALNLFFRDVHFVLQALVPILMFASDVVVPIEGAKGWAGRAMAMNPLTSCFAAYRSLLFKGVVPDAASLAPAMIGAVAALALGLWYFHRVAPRFAEEA